ncbi:uncharacterized protein KY384_000957 [Bacidia gigantensis]|uniref:uncharacterized protein n=1 Tax=Bacidia gigantensis TaxID=2732470 RepID=UPI001D052A44|nr:uncharacterized protein KY384_000957 [Bacidia gigantensis]KAG8534113.1 hypothetical protein KY384_000957 [Bacidia gigantensis]
MAEKSTKAAGRRNAPLSARGSSVEPRRTARTTRSQSRELSDNESGRDATRIKKGGKSESRSQQGVPTTRKSKPTKASRADPDLSMVVEEDDVQYPQLQEAEESESPGPGGGAQTGQANTNSFSKSPGGASAFSGTTARTSRTAQEIDDLTSESLQDALPDLCTASERLLDFLISPKLMEDGPKDAVVSALSDELENKRSRTRNNLNRRIAAFNIQREVFSTKCFIDIKRSVRTILNSRELENAQGPWRPESLLQKINIAALTAAVFSPETLPDGDFAWDELDSDFPHQFVDEQDDVDQESLQLTLQLALEIRTQYVITLLTQRYGQPGFDLDDTLNEVFNERTQVLKGWNFNSMRTRQLSRDTRKALVERLSGIRQAYQQAATRDVGNDSISMALAAAYPRIDFLTTTLNWEVHQLNRLENIISPLGGPETIIESLIDQVQTRRRIHSTPPSEAKPLSPSEQNKSLGLPPTSTEDAAPPPPTSTKNAGLQSGAFSSNSFRGKQIVDVLKQRKSRRDSTRAAVDQQPQEDESEIQVASTSAAPIEASPKTRAPKPPRASIAPRKTISETPNDDVNGHWMSPNNDSNDEDEEAEAFQTQKFPKKILQRVRVISSQQQAESNKENEPEVRRSHGRNRQGPSLLDPQANARSVNWNSQDEDDIGANEERPQTSHHPPSTSSRSRAQVDKRPAPEAPLANSSPSKRPRFRDPRAESESSRQSEERPAQSPRPLQERQTLTQAEVYREVNNAAKARVALTNQKRPQTRVPWSDIEEGTLMDLIGRFGNSYAQLLRIDKQEDNILKKRDQVALKDKARNMKTDLLKYITFSLLSAGTVLPPNFQLVPISKLQVEKLAGLGIIYDPTTGHRQDGIFQQVDDDD